MSETVLSRLSHFNPTQNHPLTSSQAFTDTMVGHFVEEATSPTTLAAFMAGGMAYRFGRIGILAAGEGRVAAVPLQALSVGFGLGTEVSAFEMTSRALSGDRNPNRWNWSGQGGIAQGLTISAMTFGMLKGAGFLAREQNIVLQHAFQTTAMVAGHNTAGVLGIAARPEGSLAEQLLHAEVTNIQLGAGGGLLHTMAPGIAAFERGLDLSLRAREADTAGMFPHLSIGGSPLPELALEGVGAGSLSSADRPLHVSRPPETRNPLSGNMMAMSSSENGNGSMGGSGSGKPPTGGGLGGEPATGGDKMRIAYGLAGELVRDRLEQEDPDGLSRLQRLKDTDVVVVSGDYDKIDQVLKAAQVPFITAPKDGVSERLLESARAVFVNCVGDSFPAASAHRLARFVETGGFLLTTDWALKNVIQVGFPGFVRHNGKSTSDDVVSIRLQQEDPLFRGFFEGPKPVWWLEPSSYPLQVLDRSRVQVPVYSEEMKAKYGNGSVVVRFPYGQGVVYHLVSHLYAQRSEARDARHRDPASTYATSMGASRRTQQTFQATERSRPDVDLGTVQSATSTTGFVSSVLISQIRKQQEGTHLAGGTGIFNMMNEPGAGPSVSRMNWAPRSAHFSFDAQARRYRYHMPTGVSHVVIGRLGDEVILGDQRVSRRHVTLQRLGEGNQIGYSLTAHNFTTLHRGTEIQNLDRGQKVWILPGDILQLTPDVLFLFDPR